MRGFSVAAADTFGNAGLGILEGPGYFLTGLGIHRALVSKEQTKLTFRWKICNAFNRADFSCPNAVIGAPSPGIIRSVSACRSMQLAPKWRP